MPTSLVRPSTGLLIALALCMLATGCGEPVEPNQTISQERGLSEQGIRVSISNALPVEPLPSASPKIESGLKSEGSNPSSGPLPAHVPGNAPPNVPNTATASPAQGARGQGRPPMLAVRMPTGNIEGLPIGLFSDKTLLMRTNGSIEFLDNHEIVSHRITNQPFETQDLRTLSRELQSEFGREYRVRNAVPYLVVAKPDRMGMWCEQFHRFHDSIRLFCSTNNIPLRTPEFPLVAVVFETRKEFDEYARLDEANLPPTCVGYYSQKTNRIVLFENLKAKGNDSTLQTICHEATHQLAFNSGMHQRLAETPVWVAEGFAVQFEAPAYCDYASRDGASYWPPSQRQGWKELKQDRQRLRQLIHEMIGSDEPFKTDTLNAYTAAWALNSYLSQRRSRQYVEYMRRIGSLKPFVEYSRGDRMRDFTAAFGPDVGILIRETIQHVDRLP